MTPRAALVSRRLRNQHLIGPRRTGADDVVAWLGAVQAQEYAGAKWALGQRATRLTEADVDRAFDAGEILRTHVLRPTWHFVSPRDIRWLLALTAPRVHAVSAYYRRQVELDARLFTRAHRVIVRALETDPFLTRTEIGAALARARISATGPRLAHILMHAELEAIVCSGPRRGKQFTYALLDRRAPSSRTRNRDASLAELATRYFTSHGPATIKDYVWWSGLTVRDARDGIALAGRALESFEIDGHRCWAAPTETRDRDASQTVHLLPIYDEFLVAYRDRHLLGSIERPVSGGEVRPVDEYGHYLVVGGRFAGTWRRAVANGVVEVVISPLGPLREMQRRAVDAAAAAYGTFIGQPARVIDATAGVPRQDRERKGPA